MSNTSNTPARITVRSSRLWAAFHLNCTRLLFPASMTADAIGVSTTNVDFWMTPWRRVDEHLPLSHIAEVTHVRGFFWDAISVESSGGLNPLRAFGVSKPAARDFVDHVRARLNEVGPIAPGPSRPPRR
jgi:hypothetical protein